MKGSKFFAGGQELLIDRRLGGGGEGEVFAIRNMPGFAIKAYHQRYRAEKEPKVRAMVERRLADTAKTVAFPQQVVVDEHKGFVGFVMQLVENHKEIHELQTPGSRQQHFPKADYAFIVRVALNVARVFAQVHASGCVIGDINERGILVSSDATVVLIDADSFQVNVGTRSFLCTVGRPEYTPPELQGKSLRSATRILDHDAFGLAVCLFRLLCMDRHPFSGRFSGKGEMPLEKAIEEYRFAYSSRDTGMAPPPGSVRLDDFPAQIGNLFESAFSPRQLGKRPSAITWVEALRDLEKSLRSCSTNKLHRFSQHANGCPWCRMESEFGRPLFLDVDLVTLHVAKGHIDPATGYVLDLAGLLSSINSIPIPQAISVTIPTISPLPKPSKEADEAQANKNLIPLAKIGGAGVVAGAVYAFASGLPGILALLIAALGGWILTRNPSRTNHLVDEYRKRATVLASHVEKLQRTAPIVNVIAKKAEALRAVDEFKTLASQFADVRSLYDRERRKKQLEQYLARFPIRGSAIGKVRSSDVAQLASFGFSSALDARLRDVKQVHGIGPVKAASIEAWVRGLEAKFQFQIGYTPEDNLNIQTAQNAIIRKQEEVAKRIQKIIEELRREAVAFERWKATTDPDLLRFTRHLAEAEADLRHVGEAIPTIPTVRPMAISQVQPVSTPNSPVGGRSTPPSYYSAIAKQSVSCPSCGARMVRRIARRGTRAGKPFWGCSSYPSCQRTRPI